jgi:glycosyltransferase involved in cell wall biosynthesis
MITVVISSYRYGHLAAHCIESILSQSKKPEKILFVDDGWGDCFYLKRLYPEIHFTFREGNLGTVSNFQDMLNKVTTEYCMFLGADNWLRSDSIECFYKAIDLHHPDVITYDMVLTGELKETRTKHHMQDITQHQGDYHWHIKAHHGSMIYRTNLAKDLGGYTKHNDSHQTLEDLSLWSKFMKAEAKVAYIDEPFLYYRHHRQNFNTY